MCIMYLYLSWHLYLLSTYVYVPSFLLTVNVLEGGGGNAWDLACDN
jgi:hypothetical protein